MLQMENEISPWIMWELNKLRSENEKLRKVCEAAIEVVRRYSMLPDNAPSLGIMDLEKQLKEWKGE